MGKWGSGEVGKWGSGEVGKWGRDERTARSVLRRSIRLAASCFCLPYDDEEEDGDEGVVSWEEGLRTIRNLLSSPSTSPANLHGGC